MEKSLNWLRITRKGATIVASILLFVGIVLDVILRYLGISTLVGFKIVGAGIVIFAVVFALAIAISFINDKIKEKEKKDLQIIKNVLEIEKNDNKIKSKFYFLEKYENTIKLFFYTLSFFLSIYFAFIILSGKNFWDIYYFINLFFCILFILGLMEMLYSADRKTFITYVVLLFVQMCMLIWTTVNASFMFFDATSKVNLKLMDFLFLIVIFLSIVVHLIIASNNQVSKVKKTRNFGLGLILLCAGICMYFVQPIAAFILKKWDTSADLGDRVQYLAVPMNIIMYIIIALTIVAMLNVAFNTTHYIKTKNWLGLVDVAASFVCVVLCLIGILSLANFIAYLK